MEPDEIILATKNCNMFKKNPNQTNKQTNGNFIKFQLGEK